LYIWSSYDPAVPDSRAAVSVGGGGAAENFLRGEFGQEVEPVDPTNDGAIELRMTHDV